MSGGQSGEVSGGMEWGGEWRKSGDVSGGTEWGG